MFRFRQESLAVKAAQPFKATVSLKGEFGRHSLSGMRNARNNAALHKAEIAVPSHKAAEME